MTNSFSHYLPLIGQMCSIVGQGAIACLMIQQLQNMDYGFANIFYNRMRYFYHNITQRKAGSNLFRNIWSFITPYGNRERIAQEYNEPYQWLKNNPIHVWFAVKFVTSLGLVSGLVSQLGLNQIYTKPSQFFISSPLSSISVICIFIHFFVENKRLKTELGLLKAQMHIFK